MSSEEGEVRWSTVGHPRRNQFAIPPIEGAKGCFFEFNTDNRLRESHCSRLAGQWCEQAFEKQLP